MTLSREVGEPFNCFYDPNGLPEKVVYFPTLTGEAPAEPKVAMRLVAPNGGDQLSPYLTDTIGLERNVDFVRHGNNERGGLLYFDILSETGVAKLFARADEVAQTSPSSLVASPASPSHRGSRR